MAEVSRDDILDFIRRQPSPDAVETESEVATRLAEALARVARPIPKGGTAERWAHLTDEQRVWLSGKSKTDLDEIDAMLRDYRAAKLLGRAGKWLVIILMTVFGGAFALAKFGLDIFKTFKGGGP